MKRSWVYPLALSLWILLSPACMSALGDSQEILRPINTSESTGKVVSRKLTILNPNPTMGSVICGGVKPKPSLCSLMEKASTIIEGKVTSLECIGSGVFTNEAGIDFEALAWKSKVHVAQVLKGNGLKPGDITQTVSLTPASAGPMWQSLKIGQYGLIFIADDGIVVDLYNPIMPVDENSAVDTSNQSLSEAIANLLLASLAVGISEDVLTSAIEGLYELKDQRTADCLAERITDKNPKIAAIAAWGLIKLKDSRAFPYTIDMALKVPAGAEAQICRGINAICMLDDPKLAKDIIPLLSSPVKEFRMQALEALRRMKDPANIPILIKSLDDPSEENAYTAMMALAETLNATGELSPCFDLFKETPQYYLNYWREVGQNSNH
jgi:hypothetical protein